MRVGATWPASVATRNLAHWSQMYHTRNGIYMYDYGVNCTSADQLQQPYSESCNQMKYGSETPLQYDLTRINKNLTAIILAGESDLMATAPDIMMLQKTWNANEVEFKNYTNTAHMDFVWCVRRGGLGPDGARLSFSHARWQPALCLPAAAGVRGDADAPLSSQTANHRLQKHPTAPPPSPGRATPS
jgi:hypothetical protein